MKKNILMLLLTTGDFHNDSRVLREMQALNKSGYHITLVTLATENGREKLNGNDVFKIALTTRKLPSIFFFWWIKYFEWIVRVLRFGWKGKYHVIHAHDLNTLFPGYLLAVKSNTSLLYDAHELFLEQPLKLPVRIFWTFIESIYIKKANFVIAENRSRAEHLNHKYKLKNISHVSNMQYYRPYVKSNILREILDIPLDKKIILYQGLIKKSRGLDTLFEVSCKLPQYMFVVMGSGPYMGELKKLITNRQSNNFKVLDSVPWNQLPEYTSSADLGISILKNINLNHYYALSNKIFEYLSAGLPIIFSDFPEMRKIVQKYHVGYVVNETNLNDIVEKISKILSDSNMWQTMHINALNAVKKNLNWEKESYKLIKIYDSICNSMD